MMNTTLASMSAVPTPIGASARCSCSGCSPVHALSHLPHEGAVLRAVCAAFNLLLGFAGLLSFGHAAFLGSAGYVCGLMVRDLGVTPEVGILAGTVVAGPDGLGLRQPGDPSHRHLLRHDHPGTGADGSLPGLADQGHGWRDGLQGVPAATSSGSSTCRQHGHVLPVCAVFCLGFFIIYRTIHSPFGQILKAIRENEPRAISLGYDVDKFKLLAFVISAALAGTAGATKTLVFQLASLSDVHWHMSGEVVLMTLLGGLGTILGPAVGGATIVAIRPARRQRWAPG